MCTVIEADEAAATRLVVEDLHLHLRAGLCAQVDGHPVGIALDRPPGCKRPVSTLASTAPAASSTFRPTVVLPTSPPDIRKFRKGRAASTVNSGEVSVPVDASQPLLYAVQFASAHRTLADPRGAGHTLPGIGICRIQKVAGGGPGGQRGRWIIEVADHLVRRYRRSRSR
jgi:hypothetical protein